MLTEPLEEKTGQTGGTRRSILIVEDDPSLADALSIRLTRQGFETSIAHNGRQALALAQAEKRAVILLDLGLPDMNGFQLCEQLVDDERTCDTPVIVVSGMEEPAIVRKARAAGCQYFVQKPYDPNALLILIQRAIEESLD